MLASDLKYANTLNKNDVHINSPIPDATYHVTRVDFSTGVRVNLMVLAKRCV